MNNAAIGIFDSGVGGLTVAKAVMEALPHESVVYFGDTANLPYGDKSEEIIREYSVKNTEFLLSHGVKVVVVACNTASAVALPMLKEKYNIPILGVVRPAAKAAVYATRNQKIGVIGTNRTIKSGVYSEVLSTLIEAEISSKACPLFVPLIEEDFLGHEATKLIVAEYMKDFQDSGVDTLILGCTHYPLLKPVLQEIMPSVKLVDSALSTANDLKSILYTDKQLAEETHEPVHRFFASDITEKLHGLAARILEREIQFEEVNL